MRRFRLTIAMAVVLGLCVWASSAAAASGGIHGPIKGIVPSRTSTASSAAGLATGPLIFHGGAVMDTNTVYAIFWANSKFPMSRSYGTLIYRFFHDVAAATTAGATNNVYHVDTQYGAGVTGSSGVTLNSLPNQSTFGGYYVDTKVVSNGCVDPVTSACISDSQMSSEISKDVASTTGWSNGQPTIAANHMFFVFTPKNVGSCIISVLECSFSYFCAYHSNVGNLIYANMPFADTDPAACDAGHHPNSSVDPNADATINVTSHEMNEAITDPFGTAWYDSGGNEIGDKCAWMFGTIGVNGANQTINGDPYILQQEWSNYNNEGCVLQGP